MYGIRCQFGHYELTSDTRNMLRIYKAALSNQEEEEVGSCGSRLLASLYGSPVGFF